MRQNTPSSTLEFHLVDNERGLRDIYPVMVVLRTHYSEDEFVHFALNFLLPSGGRIIAGSRDSVVLCAGVFKIGHSLAWGKHIYIDDLVTVETHRSHGCGSALLQHIADIGRQEGCRELHLDSGVQRHDAHRFYLRERMDIVFFHFRSHLA